MPLQPKRERGMRALRLRNFAGTSIRSTAPRISPTGILASASRSLSQGYRWAKFVVPNFAHRYPCFCVSIALARRDTLLAAVVFNPFYRELFTAARGEGATFNGKKIHVSKVATLSASLLCTGFPVRNRKASPNLQYYGDFTQHSHCVRRDGSAALDLASVAAGRFDGFWEFNLQKGNTAAGVLLFEEAGGKVSDFAGNPSQLNRSFCRRLLQLAARPRPCPISAN